MRINYMQCRLQTYWFFSTIIFRKTKCFPLWLWHCCHCDNNNCCADCNKANCLTSVLSIYLFESVKSSSWQWTKHNAKILYHIQAAVQNIQKLYLGAPHRKTHIKARSNHIIFITFQVWIMKNDLLATVRKISRKSWRNSRIKCVICWLSLLFKPCYNTPLTPCYLVIIVQNKYWKKTFKS